MTGFASPTALAIAAFDRFRHAGKSGDWSSYLELIDDDYAFRYPVPGPFIGWNHGRPRFLEYIRHVSVERAIRVTIAEPDRIAVTPMPSDGRSTIVFESAVSGIAEGQSIETCMAVSMDIAEGRVIAHREFIGDMRPFLAA